MIRVETIPDDAALYDVIVGAVARGLVLITDGTRHVLCSTVPPGWRRCAVVDLDAHREAA
jgi:hypothetical protein